MQEVTNSRALCIYTFPLSFSCFHQNQYDIANCLEHSLKCGNSSNNPAFWNYFVINEHWEMPLGQESQHPGMKTNLPVLLGCQSLCTMLFCFFFQDALWFFSTAVTHSALTSLWQETQADHFSVMWLSSITLIPHRSFCQLCMCSWALSGNGDLTIQHACMFLCVTTPFDSYHVYLLIWRKGLSKLYYSH